MMFEGMLGSIWLVSKLELVFPAGLLQPISIPNQKWKSISMDFITGISKVHRSTKYAPFYAISSEHEAP